MCFKMTSKTSSGDSTPSGIPFAEFVVNFSVCLFDFIMKTCAFHSSEVFVLSPIFL